MSYDYVINVYKKGEFLFAIGGKNMAYDNVIWWQLEELVKAQHLVNSLVFEHKINISFLKAVVTENRVILQGVADSMAAVEKAMAISSSIMPDYVVESAVSVVQDFKSYP